nr:MFS transporter [uncultured Fusobacterium sp.]
MYIINIMWLIAPVTLFTILFILLISKSLIKGKKVFFAFFILILVYAILGVACYYFYEAFLSNQYISLLISLSCIGLGGFINLIVVYLGIAKLKKIDSKEELLRLQHDIEKNMQVEDKWLNMLFSYTADRWIVSDINADLFSKLDEGNFEEDGAEIIEMNKEIKKINENYKFLKRNLRRKYFFLKNINSITNLEKDEEKKSPGRKKTTKSNVEFNLSIEIQKIIETVKLLSDELLNLIKLEENDKTKNIEENLARTINYMSNVLYNQLKKEVINFKETKLNEFSTYIQAEKILLDNIEELRENMCNYTYKIKRRLKEIREKM